MDEPKFIEWDDLEAYHARALTMDPESTPGIHVEDLLHSALGSAMSYFGYEIGDCDDAAGCALIAAHYWTRISANHGFKDANNRTAMIAALEFLSKNGFALDMEDAETKVLGARIQAEELDRESLALILAPRIVTLNP